ncbi:peptidoglycan-binding domain-containing protein [Polaribacter sp.]|uniref:peptidoglycan-binding domain-containing protein n=1 Tax=Polaribacter sp. TaxID=1920175 RepID=UPI003F6C61ED
MKQIIILLLLIIAFFIGFGKYQEYKRYNSPNVDYKTTAKIDVNYHNKEIVFDYYKAVEELNSFVMLQWTAKDIDVRTPEDDDYETKNSVKKYSDKLATVKYYETILENAANLKAKGLSNQEIKMIEKKGITLEALKKEQEHNSYKELIKAMFKEDKKFYKNDKSALIYEVQKLLVKNGFNIQIDGLYRTETSNAIKGFEEKNNLFADGNLDIMTLNLLLE